MTSIVVIGAGNGGLTSALMLSKAGFDVTVLEAHTYPGGCAGTFRRKRYRFDAGATLAGGFSKGEVMDIIRRSVGISKWKAKFDNPAMTIHLPNGTSIPRYGDERRWDTRREHFGDDSIKFWQWQEKTADALWDFAGRSPPFPPQSPQELLELTKTSVQWFSENLLKNIRYGIIRDAFMPISYHLRDQDKKLRQFIDAQLLISAQTIGRYANAMFSASALDLPRRGVVHLEGGIGTIAKQMEEALEENGGKVKYRQKVTHVKEGKSRISVRTEKGLEITTDLVIANLTPWNLRDLISKNSRPKSLQRLPTKPKGGWGAFMIYVGIDNKHLPLETPLHHQILGQGRLTEGNSIFISLSPAWDNTRAPSGKRAITISTHTNLDKWWLLYQMDKIKYLEEKKTYINKILKLTKNVFPMIKNAELIEAGTPITFNHFTERKFGWVGGFRQENLFTTFGPKVSKRIWMVGDAIFPGQSTAAVSLGGLRVARSILKEWND